jgi:hypothetical protein
MDDGLTALPDHRTRPGRAAGVDDDLSARVAADHSSATGLAATL